MEWILLVIAVLLEMGWAVGLKHSQGFTKLVPSILTVMGMIASFNFLLLVLKNLSLGTARFSVAYRLNPCYKKYRVLKLNFISDFKCNTIKKTY